MTGIYSNNKSLSIYIKLGDKSHILNVDISNSIDLTDDKARQISREIVGKECEITSIAVKEVEQTTKIKFIKPWQ